MTTPQLAMALGATAGVSVDREHAHEHEPGWLGITRVLSMAGLSDFSGIPPAVLENARIRGIGVHAVTELEDADDQDGVRKIIAESPHDLSGFLAAYLSFRSDTGWELCGSEVFVRCHRLRVRGRVDRVFWTGTRLLVVDVKPRTLDSAGLDNARLQTAAYSWAVAEELGLAMDVARSFGRFALCLSESGRYRLTEEFTGAVDFMDFAAAARIAHRIAARRR